MDKKLYLIMLTITCLSIALVVFTISNISSNTYAKYADVLRWGGQPGQPSAGQFQIPWGIAVDSKGDVYVADIVSHQIQKFQLANPCPSGTTLVVTGVCLVIKWGGPQPGTSGGQFSWPTGVAVDSSGYVYVADNNNNRIQKFQLANPCPSGTTLVPGAPGVCLVIKWGGPQPGPGDGQFDHPYGIAVDSNGDVYVADTNNFRIQKFKLADPCPSGTTLVPGTTGVCFVTKWGSYSGGIGGFIFPIGVAVDSKGDVYVAESYNDRIQKFKLADPCPSGTTLVPGATGVCFVTMWGGPQSGPSNGLFSRPMGVAVDSLGDVYVAVYDNSTVQKFQQANPCPSGTIQIVSGVCFATAWGSRGSGDGEFEGPVGIAVRSTPNICSVDIAWYNGNARNYHFVIATSTDGTTFTNKFSGDSSGTTLNSEKYTIPATDARYVRITVNGNTVNTWAAITELDVFGSSSPTGSCTNNFPISGVTASGDDGNVPENVLDGSLITRWSSLGAGQFITANLDSNGDVFVADTNNHRIQVFIDDIIPPTVTIKDPIDGTTLTAPPASVEVRAGATDNVKVKQVEFFASSIKKGGNVLLGTDTSSPYGFPLKGLSPDTYSLTAKAYDTSDNTQISTAVTVDIK